MFKGKKTCKILKEIRAQIAAENDILYITSECKHQGDCPGTCPKCEAEVRYLEKELEKRAKLGKAVTVAGLAATITVTSLSATACRELQQTDGDMLPPENEIEHAESDGQIVAPGEPAIPCVMLPSYADIKNATDTEALSLLQAALVDAGFSPENCRELIRRQSNWESIYLQSTEDADYYEIYSHYDPTQYVDVIATITLFFTATDTSDGEKVALQRVEITTRTEDADIDGGAG